MHDLVPEHPASTKELARQGVSAVGCIAGGIGLFVLGALPPIIGIIAGAVVGVVGISALLSKDPDDRKPGLVVTVAGGLAILSKIGIIKPFAATFLGIGALGLLGLGIWNGIKFLKGLKSRG
ncbi:MAG: hypothetical protein LBG76_05015 [Treponema sp.]|jgi:hypothetical protein|nr:hypothetical protein [Treponema sp.]